MKMKAVKIAKLLDVLSYIAMLGVVIYYFFKFNEKIIDNIFAKFCVGK